MKATKVKAEEIKTDAIINLSPAAITQIGKIRASRGNEEVVLRVGVRAGGCR
jgi:Fe-S cluster assembly iron-binding protein IscA